MKTIEIIGQDLFDKIRSRFTNLQMGDENGGVTMDPRQARFYDFDFTIEGRNLGRVSISINELGTLKVFYGKSLLEDSDPISKEIWYNFLREMRMFAKRRLLRFDTRDITKSNLNKDDFQYLASAGPKDENMNMNESKFEGSSKTSHRILEKTRLVIKHKDRVNMEDAAGRTRANNIKAIYVENEEGERFKYPFIHVAGAKAMQMHCAHGGRPYDEKGASIIKMSEQMAQLSGFKRHLGRHDGMNQQVSEITDRANAKLESLRHQMHSLSTRSGYQNWSECWEPLATTESDLDEATLEDYKSKFSITSFKEDLAQYFPLLHSIMQEAGTVDLEDYVGEAGEEKCTECGMWESKCTCDDEDMQEGMFSKFIDWAEAVTEGTLEPDALANLAELLQTNPDLTLGADGTAGIEALEGIGITVDVLDKLIEVKAKLDPNTPLADVIGEWLSKDDPQAAEQLGLTAAAPAPEPVALAPEAPAPEVPVEQPVAEETEDKPSIKELAQWLQGFYNKDYKEQGFESPWRKGTTELATLARKQFGENYGHMVERMISDMFESPLDRISREGSIRNAEKADEAEMIPRSSSSKSPLSTVDNPDLPQGPEDEQFEAILKLAGIGENGPNKSEVPAYKRKEKGGDWKMSTKDVEDEKTKSPTSSAGLERRKKELGMREEFDVVLKLAGLAK